MSHYFCHQKPRPVLGGGVLESHGGVLLTWGGKSRHTVHDRRESGLYCAQIMILGRDNSLTQGLQYLPLQLTQADDFSLQTQINYKRSSRRRLPTSNNSNLTVTRCLMISYHPYNKLCDNRHNLILILYRPRHDTNKQTCLRLLATRFRAHRGAPVVFPPGPGSRKPPGRPLRSPLSLVPAVVVLTDYLQSIHPLSWNQSEAKL